MIFADRGVAGNALAGEVARRVPPARDRAGYPAGDSAGDAERPLVLALPRGGVPVAARVAERIGGDLDVVVARKIGAPAHPEYGVGAIAEDGRPAFDRDALDALGLTAADLAGTVRQERRELRRRIRQYRGDRPAPPVEGRTVVVVDDGLATGVTARAALRWLRGRRPRRLILAVPVCAGQARDAIAADADEVVCLQAPPDFRAVGAWYADFAQVTDAEVGRELSRAHGLPLH